MFCFRFTNKIVANFGNLSAFHEHFFVKFENFVYVSRTNVRKFCDFCEGYMKVSRIELSTGTLKHGFLGVPKKDARKVALRVTIRTFRDPILDHFF